MGTNNVCRTRSLHGNVSGNHSSNPPVVEVTRTFATEIAPYTQSLKQVNQMHPLSFKWIKHPADTPN